jgi:cytochrome c553
MRGVMLSMLKKILPYLATLGTACAIPTPPPVDYAQDVRPILAENCFYCHGQDATKRKAKLRLDTREGQLSHEVIIPHQPDDSDLITRIFSTLDDEQMPPANSHRALTLAQKALLKRWVAEGAPYTPHWAFTAITRPTPPPVRREKWVHNPIDRFVLARLEIEQIAPSPEAPRATLIRRVSLDLTGLPPTPTELENFLADKSPNAYERLVDRLLASPHYGERMALPWLDAARYADSNGYQQDGDTFQWIWRDWVVKALNTNQPFDQFTIEQLAGDLLPTPTTEQRIATAFNRNHLLNGEGGAIPEEQRYVTLFDRVDTTATNWLGLTVACAQCHDHKFDPITQRDYYSLLASFNHVSENGIVNGSTAKVRTAAPVLDLATPEHKAQLAALEAKLAAMKSNELIAKIRSDWEAKIAGDEKFPDPVLRATAALPAKERLELPAGDLRRYFFKQVLPVLNPEIDHLLSELNRLKTDEYPRVMVMDDNQVRDTFILDRGNYEAHLEKVSFATPTFLPPLPAEAPRNRLGLARWLVSPEQPLTARVIVNRYWQTFFGLGLVKTSEDFGVQSDAPVHRALLDWLAAEFREGGWNTKNLHRLIVTSATYRQSSRVTPALLERDPENRLYARGARLRLPAMMIRDQALAASGLLVDKLGGKPVYPYQPADIWDSLAITKERDFTYPQSTGDDLYRRSLYTFWRRTVAPANMFDTSARNTCNVRTAITSTPLHALTTLNDPTFIEAARALAARTLQATTSRDRRLEHAFRLVLARNPDATEKKILRASLAKQLARFTADPSAAQTFLAVGAIPRDPTLAVAEHAAYTAVCLALLNLDETLTKS